MTLFQCYLFLFWQFLIMLHFYFSNVLQEFNSFYILLPYNPIFWCYFNSNYFLMQLAYFQTTLTNNFNPINSQNLIIYQKMASFFEKVSKIFMGSFDETALIEGTSDIIVVKWNSGQYHSTPFLVCFGHHATTADHHKVKVMVNEVEIKNVHLTLDKYGYLHPMRPSQKFLEMLQLRDGKNSIKFQLNNKCSISSEIYLYDEQDKLIVSDVDGTLTKDDIGGLYSNYHGQQYLHDGYYDLLEAINKNGYKIVWLTMRSLPLYQFSKNYIQHHTKMQGALITQPQQFFPAIKKQVLRETGNIKANMMLAIRNLFPQYRNPFGGGLGNRINDAIAYRAAGMAPESIFIIDTKSKIQQLSNKEEQISYRHMSLNIDIYFPKNKFFKKTTFSAEIDHSEQSSTEYEINNRLTWSA